MQPRESRQPVVIRAHMRHDEAWRDVTIRNISPNGMLLMGARPPVAGSWIEIRKASLLLVGRIVWVKGSAFGIRLIERLNFNVLLSAANEAHAAQQAGAPDTLGGSETPPRRPPDDQPPPRRNTGIVLALVLLAIAVLFATADLLPR